jgi:hypothetical protein
MWLAAMRKTDNLGSSSSTEAFKNSKGIVISPDDQSMAGLMCLSQGNPSITSSEPKLVIRKSHFLSWSPIFR